MIELQDDGRANEKRSSIAAGLVRRLDLEEDRDVVHE